MTNEPGGPSDRGGTGPSAGTPPDDDSPALRVATTEARRTLDEQLDTLEDVDDKAMRLLRFSVALLGVVVSVLSVTDGSLARRSLPYVVAGLACLVAGAVVAGVTYTASPRIAGVSPADLERVADADANSDDAPSFRRTLLRSYADWIRFNAAANARAALLVTVAILFVVAGAVGFALGLIRALAGPLSPAVLAVAVAGLLLAAYGTGVHRQFARLRDAERPPVPARRFSVAGEEPRFEGQLCHKGDVGAGRGTAPSDESGGREG